MLTTWMLLGSMLIPAAPAPTPKTGTTFEWPQWRGPNRDGVSAEKGLLQEWPMGGPKLDWTAEGLGGGFSTIAVTGGFIYGTGTRNKQETLWCRTEKDGKEVWATPFGESKNNAYGEGVSGTPTVVNGKVYCVGVGGTLICAETKEGKILWRKSYIKDFGGKVHDWGYAESVLVDGDKVICTPGSLESAVVALKADSGDTIWKTELKTPGGEKGGYSSPVKTTVNKTELYLVLLGKKGGGGITAVDAKTGKLYCQYNKIANNTANIPTPVVRGDMVWCSTGYGDGGSALLKIVADGDGFKFEELKYYNNQLQNHHGGMVLVGDYVFFGNRHNSGIPACVDFKTGNIKWKEKDSPAGEKGGSGCVVYADGMLYFHYENGKVALVSANPDKFELKGSFDLPKKSGKPSWAHPVVVNGHLYVRDQDKLHCFDVKQ